MDCHCLNSSPPDLSCSEQMASSLLSQPPVLCPSIYLLIIIQFSPHHSPALRPFIIRSLLQIKLFFFNLFFRFYTLELEYSPGDLLDPGIEPMSPALQADSLLVKPPRKPALVSAVQQSESAIHIHISHLFWISFSFRSPQSNEWSFPCYKVGSYLLTALFMVMYICQSQSPNSPHSPFLLWYLYASSSCLSLYFCHLKRCG